MDSLKLDTSCTALILVHPGKDSRQTVTLSCSIGCNSLRHKDISDPSEEHRRSRFPRSLGKISYIQQLGRVGCQSSR